MSKFLIKMATKMESRLTVIAIMSFSISFWLFISVLINIFQHCVLFDTRSPPPDFQIFKYHFVAALILKTHKEHAELRICDTSILNPFWTITAAHCLSIYKKAKKYHIRIKSNSHDWKTGQEHRIQKYLTHYKYLQNQTDYDIALIRIIEPIVGARVSYIEIANFDYNYKVNSSAMVVSWSIQNAQASLDSRKLKKLPVLILKQDCWVKSNKSQQLVDGVVLCAGSYNGKNKSWTYGSGAPLVQHKRLVGIVSKGPQRAEDQLPGLYVKVSYFQSSIQEVLNNEHNYNSTEFVSTVVSET